MDLVAALTAMAPARDETGLLLEEVNRFLQASRERTATGLVAAPEPVIAQTTPAPTISEPPEPTVFALQAPVHREHTKPPPLETETKPNVSPTMTQRQLRALSRKHLFILIRDLEQELQQVKEEKENMRMAYLAACGSQARQMRSS
jgi:hypothetical protein